MVDLLSLIPEGRENAVSRETLRRLTGLDDRRIRLQIKKLIRQGYPILSSSSAKGYWQSDNISEIEQFIRESDHRRSTEAKTIEALRRLVAKRKGEDIVYVKAHIRRLHKPHEPEKQIDGQTIFF